MKRQSQFFDPEALRKAQRVLKRQRAQQLQLILDDPQSSRMAMLMYIVQLVCILGSVGITIVNSSIAIERTVTTVERTVGIVFLAEFLARLGYSHPPHLLTHVSTWIDAMALLAFFLEICNADINAHLMQLLRLLRLLKLCRHYAGAHVLVETLLLSRKALSIPLFFLFIVTVLFAGLLQWLESGGPKEDDFSSVLDASWFFVVTFSTVGYGDLSPATPLGKLVTAVAILCGVLFMAVSCAHNSGHGPAPLHEHAD